MSRASEDPAPQMATRQALSHEPAGWVIWTVRVVSFTALLIAAYLAWSALRVGSIAGCASFSVFDCEHVLTSRWSKIWGIPVSVPAAALYGTLLVATIFLDSYIPVRVRQAAWTLVTMLAIAAASSGLWFIGLQVFDLGHLCQWCMLVHACALLLGGLVLWQRPLNPRLTAGLGSLGVAMTALLITIQLVTPPPKTYKVEQYVADSPSAVTSDDFEVFEMDEFLAPGAATSPSDSETGSTEAASEDSTSTNARPETLSTETLPTEMAPTAMAGAETTPGGSDVMEKEVTGEQPEPVLPVKSTTEFILPAAGPSVNAASAVGPPVIDGRDPAVASPPDTIAKPEPLYQQLPQDSLTNVRDKRLPSEPPTESSERPAAAGKEIAPRLIKFPGVRASLHVSQWPLIGSPDAPFVLMQLFDYTCPHCQKMNQSLRVALERYPRQLAVLTLPVPLNGNCNSSVRVTSPMHADACELARLALAVWRIDPEAFPVFHHWLCEVDRRTAAQARSQALKLVGGERLGKEVSQPVVGQFITKHVQLYQRAGAGLLPKLFTERATVSGNINTPDELCRVLEQNIGGLRRAGLP